MSAAGISCRSSRARAGQNPVDHAAIAYGGDVAMAHSPAVKR
jgi:hypothetical protein